MAKPIFLVKVSTELPDDSINRLKYEFGAYLSDWHVLVIRCLSGFDEQAVFMAFGEKDMINQLPEDIKLQL